MADQSKNVRFFAGSKKQYLDLGSHSTLALYFCHDTRELFWGDMLISDGMRVVAELPKVTAAADGVVYFEINTRNGYVLNSDRTDWIQVIKAPDTDSSVKAISFAGIEMEEADGVFTIDRRCAREALGFIVPEGMENDNLVIATKDFVQQEIDKLEIPEVNLSNYATKSEIENLASISYVDNQLDNITTNYVTNQTLENYTTTEQLQATYVSNTTLSNMDYITATEATNKIAEIVEERVQEAVTPDAINYGDF